MLDGFVLAAGTAAGDQDVLNTVGELLKSAVPALIALLGVIFTGIHDKPFDRTKRLIEQIKDIQDISKNASNGIELSENLEASSNTLSERLAMELDKERPWPPYSDFTALTMVLAFLGLTGTVHEAFWRMVFAYLSVICCIVFLHVQPRCRKAEKELPYRLTILVGSVVIIGLTVWTVRSGRPGWVKQVGLIGKDDDKAQLSILVILAGIAVLAMLTGFIDSMMKAVDAQDKAATKDAQDGNFMKGFLITAFIVAGAGVLFGSSVILGLRVPRQVLYVVAIMVNVSLWFLIARTIPWMKNYLRRTLIIAACETLLAVASSPILVNVPFLKAWKTTVKDNSPWNLTCLKICGFFAAGILLIVVLICICYSMCKNEDKVPWKHLAMIILLQPMLVMLQLALVFGIIFIAWLLVAASTGVESPVIGSLWSVCWAGWITLYGLLALLLVTETKPGDSIPG